MTTARIQVAVDTRRAESELRQLHRDKGQQQKRIARSATRASRGFARVAGFTGAALSLGKLGTSPSAGNVDIAEEALVPYKAWLASQEESKIGRNASAAKKARADTHAAFAYQAGRTGSAMQAQDFFNTALAFRQEVETGRDVLRQDARFTGAGVSDFAKATFLDPFTRLMLNLQALTDGDTSLKTLFFEWFLREVNEEN